MSDYGVAKKAAEATEKLQKGRRDLAKLQADEDKYLKDREEKEQARLSGINKAIETATALLESVTEKIAKKAKEYRERFERFAEGLVSTLDRADQLLDSAETLNEKLKEALTVMEQKDEELKEREVSLSEKEKNLKEREERTAQIEEDAKQTYAQAKRLADWAHSDERYTVDKE